MTTPNAKLVDPIDWSRITVGVIGLGVAGYGCAAALGRLGAKVRVFDRDTDATAGDRAQQLRSLGVQVELGIASDKGGSPEAPTPAYTSALRELDLLVVSPGVRPHAGEIELAVAAGVPIWGELELAWRLREPNSAPWLCITGTNGKTTATLMLESILAAGGLLTAAVGNIGKSLVETVTDQIPYDVLAVEVGAPQLPFVYTVAPYASACLNVAPDHVDHFGTFAEYVAAKSRIYDRTSSVCVYNVDDPLTKKLVENASIGADCRVVGFTIGSPTESMLGVAHGQLVDLAFPAGTSKPSLLARIGDVRPAAPHVVANALAAAALARSYGVSAEAIREGLDSYRPAAHRISLVGAVQGVRYVDDSKATNCHAAMTSLRAYESVVWIAGGLAKGQDFDDLVLSESRRLRAVVLLGADRGRIAQALARHAPDVPVIEVEATDTKAMNSAVTAAASLARSGDTVLLAPGCASWDMFTDYVARGNAFVAAVASLGGPGFEHS